MKFLVLSDNHGHWSLVHEIITHFRKDVDYIFHCGDSEFTADDPIWEKVDAVVTGNMDFDPLFRKQQIIETSLGNVMLVHGHLHGVNSGNQTLLEEAKHNQYHFVFHGHTHVLYSDYREGILIANPGSLHRSRGDYPDPTCMIITTTLQGINVDYFNQNCQKINQLSVTYNTL